MNVAKNIGKKILELRKERKLTQEQVANRLFISQSSYARIESGKSYSWANHIQSLCDIFEITPEELVNKENVIVHQLQHSDEFTQISHLYEKLIEQYEERLREKDEIIRELLERLNNLE